MPHFSNTTIIILIAICVFFIGAKLLKVEKGAAKVAVGVIILILVLHFTGYDETVYNVIFRAPPIQPAKPEDVFRR